MVFITNVDELQALLNACSSTQEWELLLDSILVTNDRIYKQNTYTYTKWSWKLSISILTDRYKTAFSVLSQGNDQLLKSGEFIVLLHALLVT